MTAVGFFSFWHAINLRIGWKEAGLICRSRIAFDAREQNVN
jgi:hypothetical protein